MMSSETISIAYADDHDTVRQGICELLNTRTNYRCIIEARNGSELIQKLETAKVLPEICVLDIYMPEMDGYETHKAIRQKWPTMKVIMLTGHNTDYYLIKTIMAGVNGYILKNSGFQELVTALTSIHTRGHYHSASMSTEFFKTAMLNGTKLPTFSDREIKFIRFCCSNLSYMQISQKMELSYRTIDGIRVSIFKKLQINNRAALVVYAVESGIIGPKHES